MTRTPLDKRMAASGKQGDSTSRRHSRHRAPWWLHPFYALTFLTIPLVIVAYLIPETTYLAIYRTDKHMDFNFLALGVIVCLGFIIGSFFAVGESKPDQERDILVYCRWVVWPLFLLTIFGYTLWFGYNVLRLGLGTIVEASYSFLFEPDIGTASYVKSELFLTIPGVTTILHLCILYSTVEALLWVRRGVRRSTALMRFGMVASFVLAHAILLSERLALVQIAVPAAVILVSAADMGVVWRRLVKFAPLIIPGGAYALFAVGEYFRSWSFYRGIYGDSYLQFTADRFLGYYVTAINNAAVIYYYEPTLPLRHTFENLLEMPLLGEVISDAYATLLGANPFESPDPLAIYANPEFNNIPPVGLLINEYSIFLAPVAAFVIGVISVSLYRGFTSGRLIGVLLYPSWFIGLLEISRIYFWASQRYFPTLVFLAVSLILFKLAKTPVRRKQPVANRPKRVEITLERS